MKKIENEINQNRKITFVVFSDKNTSFLINNLIESISKVYKEEEYEVLIGLNNEAFENQRIINQSNLTIRNITSKFGNEEEEVWEHINRMTYARFFMVDYFPELLSKRNTIVYIDVDTLLLNPIDDKYLHSKYNYAFIDSPEEKDSKYLINWIFDRTAKYNNDIFEYNKRLAESQQYFNAGVLVINDISKFQEICANCLKSGLEIDDQNLLNFHNKGHFITSPDTSMNFIPFKTQYKSGVKIIHFAGEGKPWKEKYVSEHKGKKDFEIILKIYKDNISILDNE